LEIKVEFKDFEIDEDKINEYIEFKENEEAKIVTILLLRIMKNSKTEKSEKTSGNQKAMYLRPVGKSPSYFGKNFNDSVMNMSEVTQDSGRVVVKGE